MRAATNPLLEPLNLQNDYLVDLFVLRPCRKLSTCFMASSKEMVGGSAATAAITRPRTPAKASTLFGVSCVLGVWYTGLPSDMYYR